MTREELLAALNAVQEGANLASYFWDEFVTIYALVQEATDEQLAQAWDTVHGDGDF